MDPMPLKALSSAAVPIFVVTEFFVFVSIQFMGFCDSYPPFLPSHSLSADGPSVAYTVLC